MTAAPVPASAEPEAASPPAARAGSGLRLFAIRVLNYATNHVVNRVPSFALRRLWYGRVLGIRLGAGCGVHLGCYVWFYGPNGIRRAGVRIGERTRINRDCTLDLRGGLVIGDDVSISAEAAILTSGGMANSRSESEAKPVVIEDNVWVGMRALVMPGVTLGRGCVVGAGAVVVRDVPPLAIVFGSPARTVGTRDEADADYTIDSPLPLFE
jgi:maltose O-acetyltransferase